MMSPGSTSAAQITKKAGYCTASTSLPEDSPISLPSSIASDENSAYWVAV